MKLDEMTSEWIRYGESLQLRARRLRARSVEVDGNTGRELQQIARQLEAAAESLRVASQVADRNVNLIDML